VSSLLPRRVEALVDEPLRCVALGGTSVYAVTEDGRLFVWGSNNKSQLGLGFWTQVRQLSLGWSIHCTTAPIRWCNAVCELSFGGSNRRSCVKARGKNCLHVYCSGAFNLAPPSLNRVFLLALCV
jgi:hypothetical protein